MYHETFYILSYDDFLTFIGTLTLLSAKGLNKWGYMYMHALITATIT